MPAACQSSLLHPSTFAFRGFEGAKRQRLCRPSGNPVGVNLAGVSLFRMRAHGWRWGLWRAFGTADAARCCSRPLRSPNQCLLLAKASCFTRPPLLLRCQTAAALPTKWQPVGPESCWGFPVSDACSRVTLGAVTCLWNGWCRTVLLKAVTSAQPMPAACQSFVGVNLAGVSPFRMRADRWRWGLLFPVSDACLP